MNRLQAIQNDINNLEFYLGNEDQSPDVVLAVIAKLGSKLNHVSNAVWESQKELSDYIYNDDDPLDTVDGADDLPETMKEDVRDIQISILNEFQPD